MTIAACANAAAGELIAAGFLPDEARRDAVILARHTLQWSAAQWAANSRDEAPSGLVAALAPLIRRRAAHEPVAYITGVREFYGRPFHVSPAVLVPRPETEGVIDEALRFLADQGTSVVVDVGTGSGCLAVTLALEWPGARIVATDISGSALSVARSNAAALGARGISWVETSLIPTGLSPVDLVVSNPPYIPVSDQAALPADVRDFEPGAALFAGADGLDVIRPLVTAARDALRPGGVLIMEIGLGQQEAVADIIQQTGLALERVVADLQGIPRVVIAKSQKSKVRSQKAGA